MSSSVLSPQEPAVPPSDTLSTDRDLSSHVHGFDYARCLLAVAVVALHTRAFGLSRSADVIYDHLCSLAVPSFMLISLYLFVAKGDVNGRVLARRLERLVLLFIFWSAAYAFVFHKTDDILRGCRSVTGLVRTLVEGGNPIFYFFTCLAIATLVSAGVCRLPPRVLWVLAILSICGLWFMSASAGGRLSEELANYYNPLNFLPYAFIAPLIVAQVRQGRLKSHAARPAVILAALCAAWAIATLLETSFLHTADRRSPSAYARPSAALGATAVVGLFILISHPAPRPVRWLSDCSLGIYCTHIFVKESARITEIPSHFMQFLVVLAVSIAIVAFLRHALARQMI
jgi:surface polysaccharide O-acyltransferase-like enzyme